AGLVHELRHLRAAAELVDELLIEPRLVDAEGRVGEQTVAVERLDIVPLERTAVSPDVDAVLLHRDDEHRAGDGAAERRGVEVGHAGGGDVKGAALKGGEAFGDELRAAVDQPRLLGAVLQRLARDLVVVGLVGLSEVGGVGVRDRALAPHPVKRRAGIETAGERDPDAFPERERLKNVAQGYFTSTSSIASLLGPSIMNARVSPSVCGCSRMVTPSARSFVSQASRVVPPSPRSCVSHASRLATLRPT